MGDCPLRLSGFFRVPLTIVLAIVTGVASDVRSGVRIPFDGELAIVADIALTAVFLTVLADPLLESFLTGVLRIFTTS